VMKVDRGRVHLAFEGDGALPVHLAEAFQASGPRSVAAKR